MLAAVFGATARVRGTRALHPVGVCGSGSLALVPGPPSGVPLLDSAGPHPCQVRWSRAVGLRRGWDIEGMALRIGGAAAGDLLLASTGRGVVGRHALVVRAHGVHGTVSTLLPLRTARGDLLVRLDPEPRGGRGARTGGESPPTAYRLFVAAPGRPWHERGRLTVDWDDLDCARRHDPVGHPPVGTWVAAGWAALRDPSYAASQRVEADRL